MVVDPCAAVLVFVVTGLLCVGIKEVSLCCHHFPSGANSAKIPFFFLMRENSHLYLL